MVSVARLQAYLRHRAHQQYEAIAVPFFTLFWAATEVDGEQFLRMIGGGRAFVGWLKGQPVGVGMFTSPFDGVTEIMGLATLEPYRRRGIATKLTAQAVERALEQEVEVICLTAADEQAGRVYERVGFVRHATMLAYTAIAQDTEIST